MSAAFRNVSGVRKSQLRGAVGKSAIRVLGCLLLLLVPGLLHAQTTEVTGTITDPRGYPYSKGTIRFVLFPPGTTNPYFTSSKAPVQSTYGPFQLGAAGTFTIGIPDNDAITPSGTEWQITVCSPSSTGNVLPPVGPGSQCFSITTPITGMSLSLTTQLDNAALTIAYPCLPTCDPANGITSGCTNSPIYSCGSGSQSAALVQAPLQTFYNDAAKTVSTVEGQSLGTLPISSLTQGSTTQAAYRPQYAAFGLYGPVPIGVSGAQLVQTTLCSGLSGATNCRFKGPVAPGDMVYWASTVHTGSWAATDTLGNPRSASSGSNGYWWSSVDVPNGDSADCATTDSCDGISITTTWTNFTIVGLEYSGVVSFETSNSATYYGSGPAMSATAAVTTANDNDLIVTYGGWEADLCSSVTQFALVGTPSYANSFVYPVQGAGGGTPYDGYMAIVTGNAATPGSYSTEVTGLASGSGCGAGAAVLPAVFKTLGVASDMAVPRWRPQTCLDFLLIDPNLLGDCNPSGTSYLSSVSLTMPSDGFYSTSSTGGAITAAYGAGLTSNEGYIQGVSATGAAGLYAPLTLSIPTFTGTVTANDCAKWSSSGVLTDAGAPCSTGSGGLFSSFQVGTSTPITTSGNYIQFADGINTTVSQSGLGTSADPYVVKINSSGGSSTTTAQSGLVMASPVTTQGTAASATVGTPCTGNPITTCSVGTVTVGQTWIAFLESGNQSSSYCTVSSSLGNIWTPQSFPSDPNETVAVFFSKITVAGSETLTLGATDCSLAGTEEAMVPVQLFNVSGVDVVNTLPDAPVPSLSITGNYAFEGYLLWASNAAAPNQISAVAEGTQLAASNGAPSYMLNLYGAQSAAGTQTFHYNWTWTGSYGRGLAIGLIPKLSVLSVNVISTTTGGSSVASIATGASVSTGQGIIVDVGPWTTTRASCNATDTLGNTFAYYAFPTDSGDDALLIATSVGSGADTITFNASCANSSGSRTQGAWVVTTSGPVTPDLRQLSQSAGSSSIIHVGQPNEIVLSWSDPATTNVNNDTFSPAPYTLAQSTVVPSYILGLAQPPYATSYWMSCVGSTCTGGNFVFTPAESLATGPMAPRAIATSDLQVPSQQVCSPVFTLNNSSQGYYRFDGNRCGIFKINLGSNMPNVAFAGMQDGQQYTFIFTQDATGGRTWGCTWQSWGNGTVTSNYCPALNLAPNAVTVLKGIYNGPLAEMLFPVPGMLYNTTHAAGTASISATTMATAPATLYGNEYKASFLVQVTAAGVACTAPTTVAVNLIWTDPNGSSAQTVTLGTFSISSNGNLGTPGDTYTISQPVFSAKASSTIQYSTTYTAGTGCTTDPTVQVTPILEQVR